MVRTKDGRKIASRTPRAYSDKKGIYIIVGRKKMYIKLPDEKNDKGSTRKSTKNQLLNVIVNDLSRKSVKRNPVSKKEQLKILPYQASANPSSPFSYEDKRQLEAKIDNLRSNLIGILTSPTTTVPTKTVVPSSPPTPTKPIPTPTKPLPTPTKPVPTPTKPLPTPTKPVPPPLDISDIDLNSKKNLLRSSINKDALTKILSANNLKIFPSQSVDQIVERLPENIIDHSILLISKKGKKDGSSFIEEEYAKNPDTLVPDGKQEQTGTGDTEDEINEIMRNVPGYLGTIASDEIPSLVNKAKPGKIQSFIMNLDKSSQPGSHWVAVFIDPNNDRSIEYFDSFAREPPSNFQNDITPLVEKISPEVYLKYKINRIKVQHAKSTTCGYHAINFLQDRYNGKPFKEITGFTDVKNGEKKAQALKKKVGFGMI